MTIWRTRIARSLTKATNTHSDDVVLIAIPLQQLLHTNAPQCYVIRTLPVLCLLFVVDIGILDGGIVT